MHGIEIQTTLTPADWLAYQAAGGARLRVQRRGTAVVLAIVLLALAALAWRFGEGVVLSSYAIGAGAGLFALLAAMGRLQRSLSPDLEGAVLGVAAITFDEAGVFVRKAASESRYRWRLVQESTVTSDHLFVWIDRLAAIIVPLRDLPPDVTPGQLVELVQRYATDARAGDASLACAATTRPQDKPKLARGLFRLFTFRTPGRDDLLLSERTAAAIALAGAALWLVVDRLTAGAEPFFYSEGLLVWSWYGVVLTAVAISCARIARPRVELRRVLLPLLALAPFAATLWMLLSLWLPTELSLSASFVLALATAFYLERGLRSFTERPQFRAALAALIVLCGGVWYGDSQYFGARFWYPSDVLEDDEGAETDDYDEWRRKAEGAVFAQAERIDQAVAALKPADDSSAAAWFIGFAGVGEQRVFAGEIALAEQVVSARFGAQGRSIRLVNDQRDLDALPLASPTALRRALTGVAARMNLERDVLFLALSSHGSDEAYISVSNRSLPLNDLTAHELAEALRAAAVKWKVVIVSACYSGTFIEPLKDDDTIVITAAAADRTSFGCSDDRDLTYFGEAFYRDALPNASTLRTAFEETRLAIAARETKEDVKHSLPQAHFGRAIEAHLTKLNASPTT